MLNSLSETACHATHLCLPTCTMFWPIVDCAILTCYFLPSSYCRRGNCQHSFHLQSAVISFPPAGPVCTILHRARLCAAAHAPQWRGVASAHISHFLKGFNRQGHTFFMTKRPRRSQGCHCDAVTKLSDWLTTSGQRWPTSLRRAGLVVPGNAK